MADKYKAVWISHSSISDFLSCPRRYYLRAIYKDPATGNKITVTNPHLSRGLIVHEVVESLSEIPQEKRLQVPLKEQFEIAWEKVSGEKGGFKSQSEEDRFKEEGLGMIQKIIDNPGPLANKAIKINSESSLPYYWISEEENIILCGKIDWLEYLEDEDAVHIIDFKSGKEEPEGSLQLPIYLLLATNTQKRPVKKASYWYLQRDTEPVEQELPNTKDAHEKVMQIAKRIKLARQLEHFKCPKGGCIHCGQLEEVLKGNAKKVAISQYRQDIYIIP